MKKLKIFLMMAVLSVVLCACGDKEEEQSGSTVEKGSVTTEKNEADREEEKSGGIKRYECLQEVLKADPEQRLIQVNDMVFRLDETMRFSEVLELIESDGEEYVYYNDTNANRVDDQMGVPEELSLDTMIPVGERVYVFAYKDEKRVFSFGVKNIGTENVTLLDDAVRIDFFAPNAEVFPDCYFCKGIRSDGEGLTYDKIKELMAPYEDGMQVKDEYESVTVTYAYTWYDSKGEERKNYLSFHINTKYDLCEYVMMY